MIIFIIIISTLFNSYLLLSLMNESQKRKNYFKSTILVGKTFEKIIAMNLSDLEYVYLSSNPSLSSILIEKLFEKNIDNVNINLLRHTNCPQNKLNEFLALNDKIYNIAIAHNQALSDFMYKKLLALDDIDVNLSLEYTQSIKKGLW